MSFLDNFFKNKAEPVADETGLDNLMFITDTNLKILSINSAVQTSLGLSSSQVIDRNLFEILFLRNDAGQLVDQNSLGINQIIASKQSNLIQNLIFLTKNSPTPYRVNIKIKPYTNIQGNIDRISFRIMDAIKPQTALQQGEVEFEPVITKHLGTINDIKGSLFSKGDTELATKLELATETEKDIFRMSEILSKEGINPKPGLVDIAQLCDRIILGRQYRARTFNVSLNYTLLNFNTKDLAVHLPQNTTISAADLTSVYFTAKVDFRWFDYLIQKLVDISIFLASSTTLPLVKLTLEGKQTTSSKNSNLIIIKFHCASPILTSEKQKLIFVQNYEELGNETNLKLGSGLEGLIVKYICEKLSIPLNAEFDQQSSNLIFTLEIAGNQKPIPTPAPAAK
jgi:hypothetical protein